MKRHAFTIVELLVVIAIIGVLVALLMPAVQMARESARRTQCSNNLSQQAKAIIGYSTAKGYLPSSRHYDPQLASVLGWVVPILPEIDQQGLRDQIRDGSAPPATRIPILCCPSTPRVTGDYPLGYGVNGGRENAVAVDRNFDWPSNGLFVDLAHRDNPAFTFPLPLPPSHPMTAFEGKATIDQVTKRDGTSSTILLAENCTLDNWLVAATEQHASVLWFADPMSPAHKPVNADYRTATATDLAASARFARPASFHPGGFMLAMCDGSTHFFGENVKYEIFAVLMSQRGERANDPTNIQLSPLFPYPVIRDGLRPDENANPLWQSPAEWVGSPPVKQPNATYPGTEF